MLRRVALFKPLRPSRGLSSRSSRPRAATSVLSQTDLTKVVSPWVEQRDPAGSVLTFYWNTETDETTPLGAPRPLHWVEVRDPAGSELTYWWNVEHGHTTPLGAARPSATPSAPPTATDDQQKLLRRARYADLADSMGDGPRLELRFRQRRPDWKERVFALTFAGVVFYFLFKFC